MGIEDVLPVVVPGVLNVVEPLTGKPVNLNMKSCIIVNVRFAS